MIDKNLLKKYLTEYNIEQSDEIIDNLDLFSDLLMEWNEKINLTAIKDPEGIAVKHLLDSLLIFAYEDFPDKAKIIDVGCGAGFPSLPMLISRNDLKMTFLDGTGKKLKFIDAVLNELNLNGATLHGRAEEESRKNVSRETYDYAVARAVAELRVLYEYTLPFVKVGGKFIAMKSKKSDEEIATAENALETLGGKLESVKSFSLPDGSERTIIIVKKISQTPTNYPRPSTKISKKPL